MRDCRYIKYLIVVFNLIVLVRIIVLLCFNNYEFNSNNIYYLGDAPRGRIIDVNGNILVDNKGVKVLVYNKLDNSSFSEFKIAEILSEYLDDDVDMHQEERRSYYYLKYKDVIDKRIDKDIYHKYINRKISIDEFNIYKYNLIKDEELNSISDKEVYIYNLINSGFYYEDKIIFKDIKDDLLVKINELNIDGLRVDMSYERVNIYDTVLNPLFGDVGLIPLEKKDEFLNNGYQLDDVVGVNYLEGVYDNYLRGQKAKYKLIDNKLIKISDSVRGNDLVLGIDIDIQLKIEELLRDQILNAKKFSNSKYYNGSYIVLSDSDTGLIKALVGIKYKDNKFSSSVIDMFNSSFTVGSVVKGASQYVANIHNVNYKNKVLDGCIKLKSQLPKCSHKSLGYLDAPNALAYSSNFYQFLNVFEVVGDKYTYNMEFSPDKSYFDKYRYYFSLFGLGNNTGIEIDEVIGIKGDKVSGDLLLNYVIGQYDTYTPLQLNQYISTISSGKRVKLRLADSIINNDGKKSIINKYEVLNDIDDKYLKNIRDGFNKSIKYGTGVNYFNYKLGGGKTGTSETYFNNIKTTTKSFVGYYNINNNNYAISIISPNIGHANSVNNYVYPINSRLSRQIANILFEN